VEVVGLSAQAEGVVLLKAHSLFPPKELSLWFLVVAAVQPQLLEVAVPPDLMVAVLEVPHCSRQQYHRQRAAAAQVQRIIPFQLQLMETTTHGGYGRAEQGLQQYHLHLTACSDIPWST
jgi:hypothetical protein